MNVGWKEKMTRFVIDAYAWIEYFGGSEKGIKVRNIIEDDSNDIFTSSITISEVISKFLRLNKDINLVINGISSMSVSVDVNNEIAVEAGKIHFSAKKKNKDFGMLDAFVAATAKNIRAKILTGDDDFTYFKEVVFI